MELSTKRLRRALVGAIAIAVVLAIVVVVLALALTGRSDGRAREGKTVTAEVTAVSSSGRSLCVDRADSDDDCGFPVVLPGSKGRLVAGSTITVTELWITRDGTTRLAWLVE
ncbi:hypothetical protein [Nocardioides plantarum]|uniref:DUF4333 domain-containing protein n=1 Tax=Nocardioides plantarum TaxID=29299 RepID=A0ABV5KHM1_9ACTN|nr:hypothetical protein [Nocardioides plantarum]